MTTDKENPEQPVDDTDQPPVKTAEYDLHIKVPEEMREKLKELALLAYKMELVNKPSLVELFNLFIGWGFAILKKQWLERVGYK